MQLSSLLIMACLVSPARAAASARSCPAVDTTRARDLFSATCRDLRGVLSKVPGATARTRNTSFLDARLDCLRTGCVVGMAGGFSALGHGETAYVWLGGFLEKKGWSRTLMHDADGPDGGTYALHKPGALCIVEGKWNHWHDERGSHTNDAYEVTVSCGLAEQEPPRSPE